VIGNDKKFRGVWKRFVFRKNFRIRLLLRLVQGEMSIIGSRPERQHFVDMLKKEIPGTCDVSK
jgi:hypothetical protein